MMRMKWQDYIEQRPEVMQGKPVLKGTRITVEHVLERLADGGTVDDLLAAHPRLNQELVRAALAYAAASLSSNEFLFPTERAG